MPTPDKNPWWRSRQQISIRYDLSINENIDAYIAFFAEVESTTRAEAMRECVEMVRAMKATTSCQPDKSDPPASHEFIEPCDFRSECKRCGIEKQDTEDASYNTACSDIALSIESRIKE